ncbi:MAG: hypothetical protein B9J98_00710 [Candidatus Terraquivivens tikiterensis]|uniref:Uncharacterized protein n=1 Tax=Candidatus Terraquivivens tikiterensis TaxID=1980982 RepID=A0A2R7YA96_9ARCH|nr:MAG: hypothetical protein B9J98_00710 [Candidatus Terraquivivens tikiterensis]
MDSAKPTSRRVAVATLFGVMIFVSKVILPTPLDKMLVIVQALLLSLSYLLLGRMGATYAAVIGGLLTQVWRPVFFPLSLVFAVAYGLMVDGLFSIFRVRTSGGDVKAGRLVFSLTLSTSTIGVLSMYVTVTLGFMPWSPWLYAAVLVAGTVSGALAGYLSVLLWRRYLARL